MSQITKQLALRLPVDLHGKVVAAANENNRSGHAEMLHRLEESFEEQPVVAEEVAAQIFSTVATEVITKVITGCFTKLEERVAAILETLPLYSITPAGDMSKEEFEALRDRFKAGGEYAQLSDLYQRHFQRFDLRGRPLPTSPTGRLSESQPELQDLPAVSGMSTLAASLRKTGCMCGGGMTGAVNFGGYHSGGFCGLPEGELPLVLGRGERVITAEEEAKIGAVRTPDGLTMAGFTFGPDSVITEKAKPLLSQAWVITGSLETMTRDRAREIIMELGGTVAGAVVPNATHALLWGPGAGSKKDKAEQHGVQQYTERQFIELIRSHGVDMPLLKDPDADADADADADGWIENTGTEPAGLTDQSVIDFKLSRSRPIFGHCYKQGSSKGEAIWGKVASNGNRVTHWRIAK